MNREEAERILAALKAGTPLISRHKAAEALEWAIGRQRWIPVSESLPAVGRPVLVFVVGSGDMLDKGNTRRLRAAYYPDDGDICTEDGEPCEAGWYENNWYEETHWQIHDNVTHWQPLPAGPGAMSERELAKEE